MDQRVRTQLTIHERLADDRKEDERRYLLRFSWQLAVSYPEVTMEELQGQVDDRKLNTVKALVAAIQRSPEDIDAWIDATVRSYPIVHRPTNPDAKLHAKSAAN